MSLAACIPDLIAQGKLDPVRGKELRERYEELERYFAKRMAPGAAAAKATEQTLTEKAYQLQLRKRQSLLQATALHRIERDLTGFVAKAPGKWRDAAQALFDHDWQERAPYSNVEARRRSILGQAHAMMADVLDRHHRSFWTGGTRDKAGLVDMAEEAFGEDSGNVAAKEMAGAWGETAEWLRQRANAAGADIGKLDKWGLPQSHNSVAVREAAKDLPAYRALETELASAREAGDEGRTRRAEAALVDLASQTWRGFIAPLLDRSRMIDRRTGEAFTPEALDGALDEVFRTIRTEGWEGRQLGAMGGGKLASQLGDERFLHFRDAEGWLAYQERFGDGTVFDVMNHHIERMSRDVAHMELLGPNPGNTVKWLNDLIESKRQTSADTVAMGQKATGAFISIDSLFAVTSGAINAPVNPKLAKRFAAARAVLVSAQLGSATVTALPTDISSSTLARIYRGMPVMRATYDFAKLFGRGERRQAIASGFIAEEASRTLTQGNRFVLDEQIGQKSGWLAERVMNATLLAPWTQNAKWTFGRGMTAMLAEHAEKPLDQLPELTQRMLRQYGFNADQWDQIRATPLREGAFLEPVDVANRQLRDRLLEMMLTEVDAAIPSTTVTGRATLSFNQRPGTFGGEFIRSAGQYKSFGVSFIQMQLGRTLAQKGMGNKLMYLAGLTTFGTAAGLLSNWLRDIRSGEDPRELDADQLGRAWLTGVGFGIFGDFLSAAVSERAGTFGATLAGPTAGLADDLGGITVGLGADSYHWARDPDLKRDGTTKTWNEQTHAGRKAARLLKRYTPGTNIWYARKGAEALLWDNLQYLFDDDAEDSFASLRASRARDDRTMWWQPGAMTPDRAPDLTHALPHEEPAR